MKPTQTHVLTVSRCLTVAIIASIAATGGMLAAVGVTQADEPAANQLTSSDSSGVLRTVSTAGEIDTNNPFFQDLGTNGRTCFSCHRPAQAWSVTPEELRDRFAQNRRPRPDLPHQRRVQLRGRRRLDACRRAGGIQPAADERTDPRRTAVPPGAEFEIVDVDDPYDCGAPLTSAVDVPAAAAHDEPRVPEHGDVGRPRDREGQAIRADLLTQASTRRPATRRAPRLRRRSSSRSSTSSSGCSRRRRTTRRRQPRRPAARAAARRPLSRSRSASASTIRWTCCRSMPGACADRRPAVSTRSSSRCSAHGRTPTRRSARRSRAARQLFNTREFVIDNVAGPQRRAGRSGVPADADRHVHRLPRHAERGQPLGPDAAEHRLTTEAHRTADLPLYTLREQDDARSGVKTTDPGRAMVTGKWADIGQFKGPILRGAGGPRARTSTMAPPTTLDDVVDFYDTRFHIGLHASRRRADLIAFLKRSSRRRRFAPRFVLSATPAGFSHPVVPGSISRTLNENVDPSPGVLTTCTSLPCRASSFREIARPRPVPPNVPAVSSLACVNAWKIRSRRSGGIRSRCRIRRSGASRLRLSFRPHAP